MDIIYQDNHLFVVVKEPNQLVQGDVTADLDLLTKAKQYIKTHENKPGNVYLGLVHRLDRPVGGAIVFAKTSKAASRLSDQLRRRNITRHYYAITDQLVNKRTGKLIDYLYKDRSNNQSYVVNQDHPNAKKTILHYECIAQKDDHSLIKVQLETGRPHQIRVQMAHAGMPIVGDQKYHPNPKHHQQIALWAEELSLDHPTLKKRMTFHSNPPTKVFPWNLFYKE
ncbi:RluA family pseudouridine synthase [Aerococcaceae bacterium DSM 111020]|nr:RluA family pseudouridine synthase [Aerococcaceae bacterium DSM 111020]